MWCMWYMWYMWCRGCVTPQILATIAAHGITHISGFSNLRAEDQRKVKIALATRRIDPADIPESARLAPEPPAGNGNTPSSSQTVPASSQVTGPPSSQTAPSSSQPSASQSTRGPSQKKRKAAIEAAIAASQSQGNSQAGPSQQAPVRRVQGLGNTTWEEGALEDAPEEDPADELYCTMTSSVVGIQYYKGQS